jgi:hypothetical protein
MNFERHAESDEVATSIPYPRLKGQGKTMTSTSGVGMGKGV